MSFPWIRSLRAKLLLFSLLLIAVPSAVLSAVVFASSRGALANAIGRQLAQVARDAADELTERLSRERKTVRGWARRGEMRGLATGDADERLAGFLASLKDGESGFAALVVTDGRGTVRASTDETLVGRRYGERSWFREAAAGRNVLRGPRALTTGGSPVMQFAVPIQDPERGDATVGVLLAIVDWDHVLNQTQHIQANLDGLGLHVDFAILDADGTVIGGVWHAGEENLTGRDLRRAGWLSAHALPRPTRRNYAVEADADKLVGFASFEAVRSGWTALAIQPLSEALAPIEKMQRRLIAASLLVLCGGLLVAVVLADRTSRPLRELIAATREIALASSMPPRVPVRSQDEIGQLAESFNAMATDLERAREDLLVASKYAFVGEVAAGVAHEIRTPLGIMRSAAQLLGRSLVPKSGETSELIDAIVSEVDRLDRVVAQLLELARPHATVAERTNLTALLARALDFVSPRARERDVALHRDLAARLEAHCDPEQMYQATLNLIVNAVEILPPGGSVSVRTLRPDDHHVAFEISDDGPGISPELQEKIFTPFFTLREGGTGLGLTLVQRFVQANHGAVSVTSTPGHGTTFRVEVPSAAGRP